MAYWQTADKYISKMESKMENLQQYLKPTIAAKLSISDVCGTLDYGTEYSNHEDYWPDRSSH